MHDTTNVKTETELRKELHDLEEKMADGNGTEYDAMRILKIRSALGTIKYARYGGTRW